MPYTEVLRATIDQLEADLTRQSALIGEIHKLLNSGKSFYDIGLEVNTLMARYDDATEPYEFTECVV